MKESLLKILENEQIMWWAMAIIIFLLSQVFKIPIKHLTKKLPEPKRKKVNALILLIPFALGLIACYLYYTVFLKFDFITQRGLLLGSQSVAIYGIVERFLGGKNQYETDDGKAILQKIDKLTKKKKISKEDLKELLIGKEEATATVNKTTQNTNNTTLTEEEQEKLKQLLGV